jgi:hypothetical protein
MSKEGGIVAGPDREGLQNHVIIGERNGIDLSKNKTVNHLVKERRSCMKPMEFLMES